MPDNSDNSPNTSDLDPTQSAALSGEESPGERVPKTKRRDPEVFPGSGIFFAISDDDDEDDADLAMTQPAEPRDNPSIASRHKKKDLELKGPQRISHRPASKGDDDFILPWGEFKGKQRSFPNGFPSRRAPAIPQPANQKEAAKSLLRGPGKPTPSMDKREWTAMYKTNLCRLVAREWPEWLIRSTAERWAYHGFPHGLPEGEIDDVVDCAFDIVHHSYDRRVRERNSSDMTLSKHEALVSLAQFAQVALNMKYKPDTVRVMTRAEAQFRFAGSILREDVECMLDKVLNRPA